MRSIKKMFSRLTKLRLATPTSSLNEVDSRTKKVVPTMKKSMQAVPALVAVILMHSSGAFRCFLLASESPQIAASNRQVGQDRQQTQGTSEPKESLDPLDAASKASALLEKIKSAVATATWEEYVQRPGDNAPALWTKAKVKIHFDKGRYLLRFDYQTKMQNTIYMDKDGKVIEERVVEWKPKEFVVLWDGKVGYAVTFWERIRPSGCQVEIYSSMPATDINRRFFTDPARLQVLDISSVLKNVGRDAIKVSKLPEKGYRASYLPKPWKGHFEFDFQPELGFHVTSHRLFDAEDKEPFETCTAKWKKTKGVWHVDRLVFDSDRRKLETPGSFQRSIIQFDSFDPRASVDDNLFSLESLNIPANAKRIDRRPDAQR